MNRFSSRYLITTVILGLIFLTACQSAESPPVSSAPTPFAEVVIGETAVSPTTIPPTTASQTAVLQLPSPTPSSAAPPIIISTADEIASNDEACAPDLIPSARLLFPDEPVSDAEMAVETAVSTIPIVYAGTAVPDHDTPISADTIEQLTHVAQWGNGEILSVVFTPDGNTFLVGTANGFYEYASEPPHEQLRSQRWDTPFHYENMFFSEDGRFLLLSGRSESRIAHFADGRLDAETNSRSIQWVNSLEQLSYNDNTAVSADGALRFSGKLMPVDGSLSIADAVLEVYDNSTGELLHNLADETVYVEYTDYMAPSGCDLRYYGTCGNAFDPSAMGPYRVSFSPTGETLSVMYRASNLWNSDDFSLLHVYSMDDGRVIARIGDFNHPIKSFAYAPDGQSLLVAHNNGSIRLWDMDKVRPVSTLLAFDDAIIDVQYSFDGQYLLVQRPGSVEKRLTSNGQIQARYPAESFALSPVANIIALGDEDGQLIVQDMETERPLHTITAHTAEIYALIFSPNGRLLTSSGDDCRVQSWDAETGAYAQDFAENVTEVDEMFGSSRIFIKKMLYVNDDQLLGYGSWSRVVTWDTRSGETNYMVEPEPLEYYNGMVTLDPHFPEFLGFNPENQNIVINYVEYDLDTGERLGQYEPSEALPKDCSGAGPTTADGKLMFTVGYDTREGQICVLDTTDQHLVQSIRIKSKNAGNYDPISWLYLSPDGSQLLISSYSGTLQLYQIVDAEG